MGLAFNRTDIRLLLKEQAVLEPHLGCLEQLAQYASHRSSRGLLYNFWVNGVLTSMGG